MGKRGALAHILIAATFSGASAAAPAGPAADFRFKQDTLSFANSTVFAYAQGKIVSARNASNTDRQHRYTRRCFVMSRAVLQFHKFARFDPNAPALDDKELSHRIRVVAHYEPWQPPLSKDKRTVFPGYHNLRELSERRAVVLQRNIGLGWPAYARLGNFRMFFLHTRSYQAKMHDAMERALAQQDFFVAYLSDFPILHINHCVLVYARKTGRSSDGIDSYLVYDPNHPDGPRELRWLPAKRAFDFQKDQEFAGGFTRVFQVYGKPLQ